MPVTPWSKGWGGGAFRQEVGPRGCPGSANSLPPRAEVPARRGRLRAGTACYRVTTSAALSAGTLITTVEPVTRTRCGAGWNDPRTLTAEPAIVMALDASDGAVMTYSPAWCAGAGNVMVAVIAALL